jgi:hypothetical protein
MSLPIEIWHIIGRMSPNTYNVLVRTHKLFEQNYEEMAWLFRQAYVTVNPNGVVGGHIAALHTWIRVEFRGPNKYKAPLNWVTKIEWYREQETEYIHSYELNWTYIELDEFVKKYNIGKYMKRKHFGKTYRLFFLAYFGILEFAVR